MGKFLKNRNIPTGSTAVVVPVGSSANRPQTPKHGAFRYNTDLGALEYFNGTAFIELRQVGTNIVVDTFTGDASTLTFALSTEVVDVEQVVVFVGYVYQPPTTYSITGGGNDITFSAPPPNGAEINVIHNLGT
jgi:hypothetical protein